MILSYWELVTFQGELLNFVRVSKSKAFPYRDTVNQQQKEWLKPTPQIIVISRVTSYTYDLT